MTWRRLQYHLRTLGLAASLACPSAFAAQYQGRVLFNGLPLPGATVTATQTGIQSGKRISVLSDQQGLYTFPDLANGPWTLEIEMLCFSPLKQQVTIAADTPLAQWELKLLPLSEIVAKATSAPAPIPAPPPTLATTDKPTPKPNEPLPDIPRPADSSDGLLINGSTNNASTSQYALAQAFGNTRSSKSLYNGSLGFTFDNSAIDARPYSVTGLDTPKASYNRLTGFFTFGGPINIPPVMRHGPNVFLSYQWTRDRNDLIQPGLVPTQAQRTGDLSGLTIFDPATGLPFSGRVPISPQAQALLAFYPLPNIAGNTLYNFQAPTFSDSHQDALQSRLDKTVSRRDQLFGTFAFQDLRSSSSSLFNFVDTTDLLGLNTTANWSHRFNSRLYQTLGYRFSRLRTQVTPNFAGKQNISGAVGITGNNQDPTNWGPPALTFSTGIASLSDAQSSFNRNRTDALSYTATWSHRAHNVTFGGDFRRQEFNVLSQTDPRGTFTFTGAATQGLVGGVATGGNAFADFLIGKPDTSSIAFGNADKYLRQSVADAFVTDDWRLRSDLTLNIGVRWEYGEPISETKNRLVNLDIAPGFSAVAPVLASNPHGPLTGQVYPNSLLRSDFLGVAPLIGLSWRPIAGSTLVIRSGYGIYHDTSVYQATALQLAQQSPLSKSLLVQNSPTCPLTLTNGFPTCSTTTANTFAVDPNFRVGYAQTWQLSAQRDLPAALVGTITYLGIKGTRGVQQFLPNTYPIGAANPCPLCPVGYIYRTSNGDSTRESLQAQLRRRLRSGFTATLQYTYSKSLDNDAVLGGQGPVAPGAGSSAGSSSTSSSSSQATTTVAVAQNWLDLRAERGPSTFDQRNLLNLSLQYTSGTGLHGGALMTGWHGILLKDWTALGTLVAGSGLPETPIYLAATPGTGYTGSIRPNRTAAPLYTAPAGYHLNPAAYTAPATGQWGNAGRDSILGPGQLTFNASLARTFRLKDHTSLDLKIDSTNLLNHVVFTGWNTIVNGSTFGLPVNANPMRSLQTTLRVRY